MVDLKLHSEVYGEGSSPDVLVCNGLSQSTANWRGLARNHSQGMRWLLFDARGHGKSGIDDEPLTIDHHVSDILRVMAQHETEMPVLMGFSHGARVALRAAAEHPERFSALVLISCGAVNHARRRAYVRSWEQCLHLGGVEALAWSSLPSIVGRKVLEKFDDLELLVRGSVSRNQEAGLKAVFAGMRGYPEPETDAVRVTIPTLVVRGGEDPLLDSSDTQNFLNWIPTSSELTIDDCGHTLPLEEPESFTKSLFQFIKKSL
jgi:pimeloyl-ACP methyl ester carboxylesterase